MTKKMPVPMAAEAGMVISHARIIFFVIPQFTDFGVLLVPTPITEEVITCVALIGKPVRFAIVTTKMVAIWEAKELWISILQISMPTVLIMLYPPVIVPVARAAEQAMISQRGISISAE